MTDLPPVPDDFPEVGSTWYCTLSTWPGPWQIVARKGSQAVIDEPRFIEGTWRVTFTSYVRSDYVIHGCSMPAEDFYNSFQVGPMITLLRTVWTSVWGTINNPTPLPDPNNEG